MKLIPLLLLGAMWIIGMPQAIADEAEYGTVHLQCRGVDFKLRTESPEGDVLTQYLTVTNMETREALIVALPALLARRTRLDETTLAPNMSITRWACRHTRAATFLEVLYKCNDYMSDRDIGRYCARSGEWLSFIDLKGRLMDAGYRPDDPRYRSLERKIGLPDAVGEEPRIEPLISIR